MECAAFTQPVPCWRMSCIIGEIFEGWTRTKGERWIWRRGLHTATTYSTATESQVCYCLDTRVSGECKEKKESERECHDTHQSDFLLCVPVSRDSDRCATAAGKGGSRRDLQDQR